ncbi:IS982 family transposase [Streptomyces sp. NPDC046978]|uniref:IS982 family transposase n=1 Tax=Streptomyces sp. NPDC046978 TaxID=3154704 RepID=UPI0033D62777
MTNDLDTLATALYARIDDELKASPWWAPARPAVGIAATLSDTELLTLAVTSALLGYTCERRWLRRAGRDFRHLFPCMPGRSGHNKRLRAASALLTHMIRIVATDTTLWSDDVWVVDSTPVGCGCSRETAKRSDLAGWAQYGYCASHSRYFWGLRLHLVCTLGGLPVLFAVTDAKADERETLRDMLDTAPDVVASHPNQTIIGDKNYYGREFEHELAERHLKLLRPTRKGEPERSGAHLFKPLRQVIESINQTLKGEFDLERHGGKSPAGVIVRILSRILALTAAIWHNDKTDQPVKRSLIAYDY